jgi:hypothetical protein
MKKTALLFCSASVFLFASIGYGQQGKTVTRTGSSSSTMAVPLPIPPAIEFDIKDQPDSPLKLIVDQKARGRLLPGSPMTVRNDGGSTIAAFVLRVDIEPYGMNKMVIVGPKGLGIGQTLIHGLGMSRFDDNPAKPVVSVDYVQFADGTSWGEDSLGKSKNVSAYLKGRALALERLQQLLVGQDDTEIRKTFDVYGSSGFAEPNLPTGRPPRSIDYEARGYDEIINLLRRMPRNTETAKDLARKLEVMAQKPGQ